MADTAAVEDRAPWVPPTSFAIRLLILRRHLELTQREASRLCGLDDGSWSNWERGSRPRAMDQVVDTIAQVTGCNRDWLMWGSPLMYTRDSRPFGLVKWSSDVPEQIPLPLDAYDSALAVR